MRNLNSALLYIFATIGLTVIGQLMVKYGMMQLSLASAGKTGSLLMTLARTFTSPWVIGGLSCAAVAAVAWTMAISRSDLGFAYPFMGLAIVLVLALSGFVLGEHVPATRWVGVGVVCIGLWLAAR